eukprot:15480641-Alexandrium_andersonii.AAC.1
MPLVCSERGPCWTYPLSAWLRSTSRKCPQLAAHATRAPNLSTGHGRARERMLGPAGGGGTPAR